MVVRTVLSQMQYRFHSISLL